MLYIYNMLENYRLYIRTKTRGKMSQMSIHSIIIKIETFSLLGFQRNEIV